jgi:nitronate monooxygenase
MHKSALLNTQQDNTVLTRAFSGRVARGIKNQFIEAMRAHAEEILPFPVQNKLSKQLRLAAAQQNNPEFMSLWAGQSAKQCLAISAAELVKKLAREIG